MFYVALATIVAVSSSSCTKDETIVEQPTPQTMTITLGWRQGAITRAVSGEDVTDLISQHLPTTIKLKLVDSKGVPYETMLGTPITLPLGEYRVTGEYRPEKTQYLHGTASYLTKEPIVIVDQTINVAFPVTQYSVNAIYDSFAIAVDAEQTGSVTWTCAADSGTMEFIETDDLRLIFCHGEFGNFPLKVTINPAEGAGYEAKQYILTDDEESAIANKFVYVQPGFWYLFTPGALTQLQTGYLWNFPAWQQGSTTI